MSGKTPSERALGRLYLTLFLRGFGARGQTKDTAPKSVRQKLLVVLAIYAFVGLMVTGAGLAKMPVFALATLLHGLTFFMIGMFVLTTAGETLFNRSEADTLLHRPVLPQELLRAKARVLVTVALWMAGALNFVGLVTGIAAPDGGLMFPVAHIASLVFEILFCVGAIVLTYQLCMKWFGRERLDGLMAMVQVVASVAFIIAWQLLPRTMTKGGGLAEITASNVWMVFVPPAWFAGLDDAIAGSHRADAWLLAALGVSATGAVLWLAMNRLAGAYEEGLRVLGDGPTARAPRTRSTLVASLSRVPPISWGLRDPVARASFRLAGVYLMRDREIKLRLYPGIAPMLVMPFLMMLTMKARAGGPSEFALAFGSSYLCMLPFMAITMLEHSQQWQATDVYRSAPILGPGAIQRGVRSAVIWMLTVPALIVVAIMSLAAGMRVDQLALLIPGAMLVPLCALVACTEGRGVPLSLAVDPTRQAQHGVKMVGMMFVAMIGAAIAAGLRNTSGFLVFLVIEAVIVGAVCMYMKKVQDEAVWGMETAQ